jgi:hypothetical protein
MRRCLAWVFAAVTLVLGVAAPASATPAAPGSEVVQNIVVVGVAGLEWGDVDPVRTPTLARLASRGSVGALSVRSAPSVTCPAEGWLTLGAGTYAATADPDAVRVAEGCRDRTAEPVQPSGEGATLPGARRIARLNAALRFGAVPGSLGTGVGCIAAVGGGAVLAGADEAGRVARFAPTLTASRPATCPVEIVDLGGLPPGKARGAALSTVDNEVDRIDRERPAGSVLMLLGIGEVQSREPGLHPAIVDGPGFDGGWIDSPSTRRPPYVQLVDVAPTILTLLGKAVPSAMAGQPWRGDAAGRPADLASAADRLVDADLAAKAQRRVVLPFFLVFAALFGVLIVIAVVTLRTRRGTRRWPAFVAAVFASIPGATFTANLAPWWRLAGGVPAQTAALWVLVAGGAAILSGTAWWLGGRRDPVTLIGGVGAGSLLVVGADLIAGAPLQLDTLLGYNPLVAGRFYGIGNIAFAVLGTAALAVAAALAVGRRRWAAAAVVVGLGILVTGLDGHPSLGADVGGVITLVPTFVVLGLLATKSRITPIRLLLATLAGVVVVGGLAVLDYLRPADQRTHLGRFVGSVLDGSAGATLHRKIAANLDLLLAGPHTIAALAGAVVVTVLVFRPPPPLRSAYRAVPALRAFLVSTVVLSGVGFATNDSGIAIAAIAALVAVPLTLAVCLMSVAAPSGDSPADDTSAVDANSDHQLLA